MDDRLPSRAKDTDFAPMFPIIIILNETFKISWLPYSPFLAQHFLSRFTFIIDIFIEISFEFIKFI